MDSLSKVWNSVPVVILLSGGIRIDRLQSELLSKLSGFGRQWLQTAQIEDQIPRLIGFDVVGERRHGRPIQACHEDPVQIRIRSTALEPAAVSEVVGKDRAAVIILQR